ncbi:MAG: DoxX family protein [Leptospiraceae bacterium]|nr:DoxX family protein [Leptospiraceae bacterium]
MKKWNKTLYWVATLWLSLGMISTGLVQVLHIKEQVDPILTLGYPLYFLTFLGVMKCLGVIAILIPKFPILKEWAYSGFFFMMLGAIYSHLAMKESIDKIFPALLLLILTILSWNFRPVNRKVGEI